MTLWAREDVSYVLVPAGSGGCGEAHTRPVVSGAPSKTFRLDCQGCENFLRADIARSGGNKKVRTINGDTGLALKDRYLGLWGASPETVPESPDAELRREHDEQANITRNAASQTETFAKIGEAVAGNAELMAKFMDLQMQIMAQQKPAEPIPPQPVSQDELAKLPDRTAEYRAGMKTSGRTCLDCDAVITRQPGQKGALPLRCPSCKAARKAA